MSRGKIVVVYGTRPEAIKLGPVVHELRQLGIEPTIVCTGQHTSLLAGTPAETDLAGGCSLNIASRGDVSRWLADARKPLEEFLESQRPIAAVVVQGDTMSAYETTRAARSLGIPVAHVEAGLRSGVMSDPWPEELFRRTITEYADWHYAPTYKARHNLLDEGVKTSNILVTGNTVVSALSRYANNVRPTQTPSQQVLVTMHRREWVHKGAFHVIKTLETLHEVAGDYPDFEFLWPMHPNVRKASGVEPTLCPPNVRIVEPLPYGEAVTQLARSWGVATDSGGLQEEAATLGVPCAVLRNVSDRPESIEAGVARLYAPTPEGMRDALKSLIRRELPRKPVNVYGNPDAAARIAHHLSLLV